MKPDVILKIRLFGAFRNLYFSNEVELKICEKSTVRDVKLALASVLKNSDLNFDVSSLISRSVLADHEKILNDEDLIEKDVCLSVLPPVCGG
jgi:molybdopterin converting factor small subunit